MTTGYKEVNGFLWPESDIDCMAVTFDNVVDLNPAIKACQRHVVAVQAGGNTGVWPKYLAKYFNIVYTFEPESANFHCLVYNCNEQNIIKMQAALGGKSGMVDVLYEHGPRNMGACYVNENGYGSVPIICLDSIKLRDCNLIQLDVEGYEREVIHGAMNTIWAHRPVIMVEDKGLSTKYGTPGGWAEKFFIDEGYILIAKCNRDLIFVYKG